MDIEVFEFCFPLKPYRPGQRVEIVKVYKEFKKLKVGDQGTILGRVPSNYGREWINVEMDKYPEDDYQFSEKEIRLI